MCQCFYFKTDKVYPRADWRGDVCFPWYMAKSLAIAAIIAAVIIAADAAAIKAVQPHKYDCNNNERPHAGIITIAAKRITRHLTTSILPTFDFCYRRRIT